MWAAEHGKFEVVRLLLGANADAHLQDEVSIKDQPALHSVYKSMSNVRFVCAGRMHDSHACSCKLLSKIVKMLAQAGADVNHKQKVRARNCSRACCQLGVINCVILDAILYFLCI